MAKSGRPIVPKVEPVKERIETETTDKDPIARCSFPLTKEGSPAWDRMQERTRVQLRAFGITEAGAVSPSADATAAGGALAASLTRVTIDTLDRLGVALAMRVSGAPYAVARSVAFTSDERESLTPVTERVLAKYVTTAFLKYEDEAALVLLLVSIGAGKVTVLREAVAASRPRVAPTPYRGMGQSNPDRSTAFNEAAPGPIPEPQQTVENQAPL